MDQTELLHTVFALRIAISCVYGAMPKEQQQLATAMMSKHLLLIEESRDVGLAGASDLLTVMESQFSSIHKAARIEMEDLQTRPVKKPARKTRGAQS